AIESLAHLADAELGLEGLVEVAVHGGALLVVGEGVLVLAQAVVRLAEVEVAARVAWLLGDVELEELDVAGPAGLPLRVGALRSVAQEHDAWDLRAGAVAHQALVRAALVVPAAARSHDERVIV